jgi:hypothetical protein
MRQVADTLVWLAMILVVVLVVYFTPRLANYVSSMATEASRDCITCREVAYHQDNTSVQTP